MVKHHVMVAFVKSFWDKSYGSGLGFGDEDILIEAAHDLGWIGEDLLCFIDSDAAE